MNAGGRSNSNIVAQHAYNSETDTHVINLEELLKKNSPTALEASLKYSSSRHGVGGTVVRDFFVLILIQIDYPSTMVFDENVSKEYKNISNETGIILGSLSARPSKQSIHNYYMA